MSESRRKVLLADDSATIRRVVELSFVGEPVDVAWVADGHAVPVAIERERPDVMLVDLSLPGRDGYDLCGWVQAAGLHGRLPVVVMAGAFESVDRARLEQLGASAIVTKPVEPGALVALVHELTVLSTRHAWPEISSTSHVEPETGGPPEVSTAPALTRDEAEGPAAAGTDTRAVAGEAATAAPQAEGEFLDQLGAALAAAGYAVPERPLPSERGTPEPDQAAWRPIGLADAFAAVLEAEQRGVVLQAEPTGSFVPPWLTPATLDEIARRVTERLAETAIQDLISARAAEVAERVAREAIERLKTPAS